MQSIIFVFCLVLAATKGQIKDVATYQLNVERSEDYIKLNQLQHARLIQDFDNVIENYKRRFTDQIEALQLLRTMTTNSIRKTEDYLNPLELLGDVSNKCVVKYRTTIPTVFSTETAINNCISPASAVLPTLVSTPLNQRNAVENLLKVIFDGVVKKCGESFNRTSKNYTSCITTATASTNNEIVIYQKNFGVYMDTADCSLKATLKTASECIVDIHERTIAQIAEAKVLINNCLLGKDECRPCPEACQQTMDLMFDSKNETIPNPFYKLQSHKGCLLFNIKN